MLIYILNYFQSLGSQAERLLAASQPGRLKPHTNFSAGYGDAPSMGMNVPYNPAMLDPQQMQMQMMAGINPLMQMQMGGYNPMMGMPPPSYMMPNGMQPPIGYGMHPPMPHQQMGYSMPPLPNMQQQQQQQPSYFSVPPPPPPSM